MDKKLAPYSSEKFRTVDPEEIIYTIDKNIISSVDLVLYKIVYTVSSMINLLILNV